jgi:hypothetical protein
MSFLNNLQKNPLKCFCYLFVHNFSYTNSEITLDLDSDMLNRNPSMVEEKKELEFRGKLIDYGLLMNHKLKQVPFDDIRFPADYSLTYESFLFYFGAGLVFYCLLFIYFFSFVCFIKK